MSSHCEVETASQVQMTTQISIATVGGLSARWKTLQPHDLPAPIPQHSSKTRINLHFISLFQHIQHAVKNEKKHGYFIKHDLQEHSVVCLCWGQALFWWEKCSYMGQPFCQIKTIKVKINEQDIQTKKNCQDLWLLLLTPNFMFSWCRVNWSEMDAHINASIFKLPELWSSWFWSLVFPVLCWPAWTIQTKYITICVANERAHSPRRWITTTVLFPSQYMRKHPDESLLPILFIGFKRIQETKARFSKINELFQ